jgi:hypothetical protein
MKNHIELKNVGRESHTYLYYIINNYDNLPKIVIFLPGSTDMQHKHEKATKLLNEIRNHKNTVFIGNKFENVKENLYDFKVDNYSSSHSGNNKLNNSQVIEESNIRPFGKWYDNKFGNIETKIVSFFSIIAIAKEDIMNHPKSYYENLIGQLENSSNPEVGHYFERSWYAIFYPYNDVKFIYE